MIINHNMNAMNAHRLMMGNTVQAGKSMEKLSSGLRINRAGDDAAGLAISEKMRGQIRGLDQSSRNAQDGISLIQTAEGALNETHSILQRMRELAVQAANDTNTTNDKGQIQNEIIQLTSEINRIGNTTEFNTIKLIDGSVKGKDIPQTGDGTPTSGGTTLPSNLTQDQKDRVEVLQGLKSWWIGGSAETIKNSFGLNVANSDIQVNVIDNPSSGALASVGYKIYTNGGVPVTGKGEELTLNINMNYFKNLDVSVNSNGSSSGSSLYLDRTMVHEMTHAVMSQTMNFASLNTWFKEGVAEFAHGADERLKNDLFELSGQSVVANKFQLTDASVASLSSKLTGKTSWAADGSPDTSQYYSAAYIATRYMDEQLDKAGVAGGIKSIMEYLSNNQTKTLDDALANVANAPWKTETGFITVFKNDVKILSDLKNKCDIKLNSDTIVKDSKLYFENEVDTGSMLGLDSNSGTGKALNAEDVIKETTPLVSTIPEGIEKIGGFNVKWTDPMKDTTSGISGGPIIYIDEEFRLEKSDKVENVTKDEKKHPVKLQVGANKGQSMILSISDMRAKALGISATSGTDSSVLGAKFVSNLDVTNGTDNNKEEAALDILSHESATAAIKVLDGAIGLVSNERSKLGAYQNRLEHTIANLGTSSENLTAAESRIRDVDMAKEMMTFSKNNILSQAAQAMLAQANQQSQGVLQLLR